MAFLHPYWLQSYSNAVHIAIIATINIIIARKLIILHISGIFISISTIHKDNNTDNKNIINKNK